MKHDSPTSKRSRLNQGRRFTEAERARAGRVVADFRPLVVRELKRLPAWVRGRYWEEAEEMLMVEVMWGAIEYDGRGSLAGYLAMRVGWKRQSLVRRFSRMAAEGVTSLEHAPVPVDRRDVLKASEDREEVAGVLTREAALCARARWRGKPSPMGPVLAERYMMGMTLEEIAQRRGVSREAVRLAVDRAVEAVRGAMD